jgi:hypothetical protein
MGPLSVALIIARRCNRWSARCREQPPNATLNNGGLVGGQVVEFLRRGEQVPRRRTSGSGSGAAVTHWTIVAHGYQRWAGHGRGFLILALRHAADLLLASGLTRP